MIQPSASVRIWAGDERLGDGTWRDTAFLLFPDDATALAAGLATEAWV